MFEIDVKFMMPGSVAVRERRWANMEKRDAHARLDRIHRIASARHYKIISLNMYHV